MRAIALDGLLREKPQPRKPDEELFTLSEAARELGYTLVRVQYPSPIDNPSHVEAELVTACGCKKQIFLPESSLNMALRVPVVNRLMSHLSESAWQHANMSFSARDFEFDHVEHRYESEDPADHRRRKVYVFREKL